ncbi:hypothetical protein FKM82_000101 [Ascaphus truei]
MEGVSDVIGPSSYHPQEAETPEEHIMVIQESSLLHGHTPNVQSSKCITKIKNIAEQQQNNPYKLNMEKCEQHLITDKETIITEHSKSALNPIKTHKVEALITSGRNSKHQNGDLQMPNKIPSTFTCHTSNMNHLYCTRHGSKYCCSVIEPNWDKKLTIAEELFDVYLNYMECSDVMTDYANGIWHYDVLGNDPVILLERDQDDETKASKDFLDERDHSLSDMTCLNEVSNNTLAMDAITGLCVNQSEPTEVAVKREVSRDSLRALQTEMVHTVGHHQDETSNVKNKERCKLPLVAAAIQNTNAGIEEENKENNLSGDVSIHGKQSKDNTFVEWFPANGLDNTVKVKGLKAMTDESMAYSPMHTCSQVKEESGTQLPEEKTGVLADMDCPGNSTEHCQKELNQHCLKNVPDTCNNDTESNRLLHYEEENKCYAQKKATEKMQAFSKLLLKQVDTNGHCNVECPSDYCEENKESNENAALTLRKHHSHSDLLPEDSDQSSAHCKTEGKSIFTSSQEFGKHKECFSEKDTQETDETSERERQSEGDKQRDEVEKHITEIGKLETNNGTNTVFVCAVHKTKNEQKDICKTSIEESLHNIQAADYYHGNSPVIGVSVSPSQISVKKCNKGNSLDNGYTSSGISCDECKEDVGGIVIESESELNTVTVNDGCSQGKESYKVHNKSTKRGGLTNKFNVDQVDTTIKLDHACGRVIKVTSPNIKQIPTYPKVLTVKKVSLATCQQFKRLGVDENGTSGDHTIRTVDMSPYCSNGKLISRATANQCPKEDFRCHKKFLEPSSQTKNSYISPNERDQLNTTLSTKDSHTDVIKQTLSHASEESAPLIKSTMQIKAELPTASSNFLHNNSVQIDKAHSLNATENIPNGTEIKVTKKKIKIQGKQMINNSKCREKETLGVDVTLQRDEDKRDKKESNTEAAALKDTKKAPLLLSSIQAEMFLDCPGNLKLYCHFGEIHADSIVSWTKDSKLLARIHRSSKDNSPVSLAIVQTSKKDQGLYHCGLKNMYGNVSTEFHLTSEVLDQLSRYQDSEGGEEIEFNQLLFREDFISDMYFGGNLHGRIATEDLHFGEGVHRKAFRSKVMCGLLPLFSPGHLCVLKVHNAIAYGTKTSDELVQRNYKLAVQECHVQNTAREYAKIYASEAEQFEHFGKVPEVIPIFLIHRPANNIPYATVEEELIGDFVKYSIKDGKEINFMRKDSEAGQKCCTFQHWVYEKTNGNLLVTDMQGVGMKLTDVGIATMAKGYKGFKGNCSVSFIDQFKALHLCNKYCEMLSLKSPRASHQKQKKPVAVKEKTQPNPPSLRKELCGYELYGNGELQEYNTHKGSCSMRISCYCLIILLNHRRREQMSSRGLGTHFLKLDYIIRIVKCWNILKMLSCMVCTEQREHMVAGAGSQLWQASRYFLLKR